MKTPESSGRISVEDELAQIFAPHLDNGKLEAFVGPDDPSMEHPIVIPKWEPPTEAHKPQVDKPKTPEKVVDAVVVKTETAQPVGSDSLADIIVTLDDLDSGELFLSDEDEQAEAKPSGAKSAEELVIDKPTPRPKAVAAPRNSGVEPTRAMPETIVARSRRTDGKNAAKRRHTKNREHHYARNTLGVLIVGGLVGVGVYAREQGYFDNLHWPTSEAADTPPTTAKPTDPPGPVGVKPNAADTPPAVQESQPQKRSYPLRDGSDATKAQILEQAGHNLPEYVKIEQERGIPAWFTASAHGVQNQNDPNRGAIKGDNGPLGTQNVLTGHPDGANLHDNLNQLADRIIANAHLAGIKLDANMSPQDIYNVIVKLDDEQIANLALVTIYGNRYKNAAVHEDAAGNKITLTDHDSPAIWNWVNLSWSNNGQNMTFPNQGNYDLSCRESCPDHNWGESKDYWGKVAEHPGFMYYVSVLQNQVTVKPQK